MGQQKDRQGDLIELVGDAALTRSCILRCSLLIEGGFDGIADAVCQPYYAARMGAPVGATRALLP